MTNTKVEVIALQTYIDDLAYGSWLPWMESFLNETPSNGQPLDINTFTGISGSGPSSRANELHRLGVLKYSISGERSKGWEILSKDNHIVNDIGYVYYYICKAIFKVLHDKIIYIEELGDSQLRNAYMSLYVVFLMRQYIILNNGSKITIYSALCKLKEVLEIKDLLSTEDEFIANIILTSIVFSSVVDKDKERFQNVILNNFLNVEGLPIYEDDKSKVRIFVNSENIISIIDQYKMGTFKIDGTYRQRTTNFFAGNYKSSKNFKRGLLYLGIKGNLKLLNKIYENELIFLKKSEAGLLDKFFVNIKSDEEVVDTFVYLKNSLMNIDSEIDLELSKLMKAIAEGIKEALYILGESIPSGKVNEENYFYNSLTEQKIYYGCPGTGKSYKLEENIKGKIVRRITFHPDYDYSSFVGSYKPAVIDGNITYSFIPQVFIKIYVDAWNNLENSYALVIEEINRGNCAEIFGDVFQLLEREENGKSRYPIALNNDLESYLKAELGEDHYTIKNSELILPANLSIYATMNTSDQSLFPIDSAFKRRWDWEYVPINYECANSNFEILIGNNSYSWLSFIKKLNTIIFNYTSSEDKQLGNWFVKPERNSKIISEEVFINKVIYYIWHDVFNSQKNEIFSQLNSDGDVVEFSFGEVCSANLEENINKVVSIINNIISE